jgi:hypothetical protein
MRAVSRWQVLGYVSFDEPDSSGLTISFLTFPKGRIDDTERQQRS